MTPLQKTILITVSIILMLLGAFGITPDTDIHLAPIGIAFFAMSFYPKLP